MNAREILHAAETFLSEHLIGKTIDIATIGKPESFEVIKTLSPIISKLSPLYANSIEYSISSELNNTNWPFAGKWIRQDPGFPDVIFESSELSAAPGLEIKAWYPLATEITARFRESQTLFSEDNTDVAVVVWMPDNIIWGPARILDVQYFTAESIAKARDNHYHNPPDYIVIEPRDTSGRTRNLQQTNTNGFKIQDQAQKIKAQKIVNEWGVNGRNYSADPEYQQKLLELQGQFTYRGDTNYAKMDRIQHEGLENFKREVLSKKTRNRTIAQWTQILKAPDRPENRKALEELIE